MKRDTIGVGIIGLGIGERHLETVLKSPFAHVAGICDLDSEKLSAVGLRVPQAFQTQDSDTLISDSRVGVVVIASYDSAHGHQVIRALAAKKHVFVEKPLCTSREELQQIGDLLHANRGLKLSSNLVLRTATKYRVLKRLITTGYIGKLYYLEADYDYGRLKKLTDSWRGRDPQYSVMLGGGIHMIDLAVWLVGEPVREVMAMGNNVATEGLLSSGIDDTQVALLKFESGVIAKISANFPIASHHSHSLKVCGTSATFIENQLGATFLQRHNPDETVRYRTFRALGATKDKVLASFLGSIVGSEHPIVSQMEVINTADIALRIKENISWS